MSDDEYANIPESAFEETHPEVDPSGLKPIPAPRSDEVLQIESNEVSGYCPVEYANGNGVRDFYTVRMWYIPNEDKPLSIELKTLKLYLEQFQELAISHEQVASTIATHIEEALDPEKFLLRCEPNVRGGIMTTIEIGDRELKEGAVLRHD